MMSTIVAPAGRAHVPTDQWVTDTSDPSGYGTAHGFSTTALDLGSLIWPRTDPAPAAEEIIEVLAVLLVGSGPVSDSRPGGFWQGDVSDGLRPPRRSS